ncbi:MAG TPA: hypothetical protein VFO54_09785, partial [Chryseosolibacter sp.]|nr:hypothetical protein [Chryseosolibacter sp.]
SFLIYAMEGNQYELSVDPEHGSRSFYSEVFDLTTGRIPQVEKVHAVLKPPMPDDELVLSGISFREDSGEIDLKSSERELKRLARLVTSNPGLRFEVEVLFEGYEEDSLQSRPDLTEMVLDTVHWKYIDIDTLGQLYERDTTSVKVMWHNDRTPRQAQSIIDYLVTNGASADNIAGLARTVPATLPESRKTLVKARVARM